MADKMHKKERNVREMLQYIFIINICRSVCPSVATLETQGQAFIQTDNELRYMGDVGLQVLTGEPDYTSQDGVYPSSPITFDPPYLDFEEQPVGMPHIRQVTVQNLDIDKSLHLLSISGSTQHFHCSFFQDKKVPPGGNTTYEVVFLARQVGNVENTLFIHTSKGSYRYQVFGVGIPNPYRVRPIIGAKVPINSSFSPLIHMHNPHSSSLQVQEVFTTGGDLHLELPSGEQEASQEFWEIPPYETKPIMKANFLGRRENNHTAFIRIKTNKETNSFLVLPVEVEVTATPGIYSPLELLDFDILRTQDDPKVLRLNLINSGPKPAYITNVTVHPPNPAISIEFRPTQLKSDIIHPAPVALISFNASKAMSPKHLQGFIKVESKHKQYELSIPYQARILKGSLGYNKNQTMFYTGDEPNNNITRELLITNTFNFTLVIYNASLGQEMQDHFTIEPILSPIFLHPQESINLIILNFSPNGSKLHFTSHLHLHTNASHFFIPIAVYDGTLKVVLHTHPIYSKNQLNFGTLGIGEHRSMTFTLRNDNPVEVEIFHYKVVMANASIELMGVEDGNFTTLQSPGSHTPSSDSNDPFTMKPNQFAVFTVNLIGPDFEGTSLGRVEFESRFEALPEKEIKTVRDGIGVSLMTARGTFKSIPPQLLMEDCFPGRVCHQDLRVYSSFRENMRVEHHEAVTFTPKDPRYYYVPTMAKAIISPCKENDIGTVYFDPRRACHDECYVGLPTNSTAGHHWLLGCELDRDVADTDQYLYTRFQQRWQALVSTQPPLINVSMVLNTATVRGFLFPVQSYLRWPSIAKKKRIQFPLTQIGNISISHFLVENPADEPVLIQILPLPYYPNPHTILDLVGDSLWSDLSDFIETEDQTVFAVAGMEGLPPYNASELESLIGTRINPISVAFLLPPGNTKTISVAFQPKDDTLRTSLLVIRNNLTIIDAVVVQGRGGRGDIRFGKKKAGSVNPLYFNIEPKHLKNCDMKKRQNKSIPPNFTVKRTFTARNVGELPFYVHGFSISRWPCEGYGFKVLECEGFELPPNGSKKIDIVFTPDFTMSRIRRVLKLHTSLGPAINYTLQATVPPEMLSKCAAALPRPHWEPIIYYSTICIMGFLLFCIFVAAYFEADRIYHSDIFQRRAKVNSSTQTFDKGKNPAVFDLKVIAGVKQPDSQPIVPNKVVNLSPINNNHKAASLSNGHSEAASFHALQRSRREPTGRSSRMFAPFRYIWSAFLSWSWTSNDSSTTPQGGANSQKSSGVTGISNKASSRSQTNDKANSTNGDSSNTQKQKNSSENNNSFFTKILSFFVSSRMTNKKLLTSERSNKNYDSYGASGGYVDDNHQQRPDNIRKTDNDLSERSSLRDNFSPVHNPLVDDDAEEEESRMDAKKSKFRKHKSDLKRKERVQEIDRDDTSSTTTESSSCLENDDKNFSTRDTTPDPLPPKSKKPKGKGRREKVKLSENNDDDQEEHFMITSNSKAHKKILKEDPKLAQAGNLLRPSSLELPYTTKLEANKSNRPSSADQLDPISTSGGPPQSKTTRKRSSKPKPDGVFSPYESSGLPLPLTGDEQDLSDSVWDMPATSSGDFSQLALQTEQFVRSHTPSKTTDDLFGLGSHTNSNQSFSSVVSADLDLAGTSGGKLGAPIGKYPPTPGGTDLGSGSFSSGHPGAIGSKPATRSATPTSATSRKSPWQLFGGSAASSPTTPDGVSGNCFGLHGVSKDRTNDVMSLGGIEHMPAYQSNIFPGLQEGLGQLPVGSYGAQPTQPATSTLMLQQLQAERRQRRLEYQQSLNNQRDGDWPANFDMGPSVTGASTDGLLWDSSSAAPTEAWSTLTDSPQRHATNTMWSNPATCDIGGWSQSMWNPSMANPTPDPRLLDLTPPPLSRGTDTATIPTETASAASVGRFDPFSTLASIWNPPTSASFSSTWGSTRPASHDN